MKTIKEYEEFAELYEKALKEFNVDDCNPLRLVNQKFKFYFESVYELVVFPSFYEQVIELCKLNKSKEFSYMILKPSPTEYFYKNFGTYNTFIFSSVDSSQIFVDTLNADPGNSPADCPISNSFLILVMDSKMNWFVLANRSYEKAVAFFKDENLYKEALSIFEYDILK